MVMALLVPLRDSSPVFSWWLSGFLTPAAPDSDPDISHNTGYLDSGLLPNLKYQNLLETILGSIVKQGKLY